MMKKYFLMMFVIVCAFVANAQTSLSETYTDGDIPTSVNFNSPPGFGDYDDTCNGSEATLSVTLPATGGPWQVTSIDIEYDITSLNVAYMNNQRSYVHFQNEGVNENAVYMGTGSSEGTYNYERLGVEIANGVYADDTELIFEMRAWRNYDYNFPGCNTDMCKIDDGTWTITVNYREVLPCDYPTDVQVTNIEMDEAEISWTDGDDSTPDEWNIEYGPEDFTPGSGTEVTASTNPHTITGLSSGTDYDVYVQASCGADGESYWSELANFQTEFDCSAYTLEITDTTDATIVCKGKATLEAEAGGGGSEIYWYDAATGGDIVGVGDSYETPFLESTTSYWASEVVLEGNGVSFGNGIETWDYEWGQSPWQQQGMVFEVTDEFTLMTVDVFSTSGGGELTVSLLDDAGTSLESTSVTLPAGTEDVPEKVTVPLYFEIPDAGTYYLVAEGGAPAMKYEYEYPNVGYPFALGDVGEITGLYSGGIQTWEDSYYFFYNWVIEEGGVACESDREEVTATISTDGDIMIDNTDLPYVANHDSADYGSPFSGSPGDEDSCGSEENYLNGHNVIYQFTATEDDVLDITLSDLSGFYAGVFIYESCAEIGESCLAGAIAGASDDDFGIEEFYVTQGEDYYIVVSSWLQPSNEYTITIEGFDCSAFEAPEAATDQNFVDGDTVDDLAVEMTMDNFTELIWYEDAAGTIEIPNTTDLEDTETYYVAQVFQEDCEGALVGITVHEIDCSGLEITDTTDDTVVCRGQMTLEATASGTGSEIYWYDAATEGSIVGIGEEFLTPDLVSTTSYWVAEVHIEGDGASGGHGLEEWSYQWTSTGTNVGMVFNATESFLLLDVEVFAGTYSGGPDGGPLTVALLDDSENELYSTTVTLPSGGTEANPIPVTVPLNFMIPEAGEYYLVSTSAPGMKYEYNYPNVGYPFPISDVGEITGVYSNGPQTWQDSYYYFFNWTISEGEAVCESDREEVVAEVTSDGDVEVTALPYNTSDDTSVYGNNFSGVPGSSCGASDNYLDGDDVVYLYTPTEDDIVTIEISEASTDAAGVFVYEACGQIGDECFAGSVIEEDETGTMIEELYLTGGEDYFIVISSSDGESVSYTLDIYGFECAEIQTPSGEEDQYFIPGSTLDDVTIETNQYNEQTTWYDDAGGTNTVPTTTVLNDGDVYYVSQTILGCESGLLTVNIHELDCDELEVISTTDGVVCQSGRVDIAAEASGVGSEIYWYDAQTGGELAGVGEEFLTPNLTATTSYWASEVFIQNEETSGGYGLETWDYDWDLSIYSKNGIAFDVIQPFTLVDVEVFSTGSGGSAEIQLQDNSGEELMSTEVDIPGGGSTSNPVPYTIPLGYQIPPGSYQLVFVSGPNMKYDNNYPSIGYPMAIGTVGEMTAGVSGDFTYPDSYYCFYNWTISVGTVECESDRVEAIAEVNTEETVVPGGDKDQTVCQGETLADLEVEGEDIQWYAQEGDNEILPVTTALQNGQTYYATQTVNACESIERLGVTVTVIELSALPDADHNQIFSQGETLADLDIEGENLTWYEDEEGNTIIENPEDVLLEDQETYYVSQTSGDNCQSPLMHITVHAELNTSHPSFEALSYYPNPMKEQLTIANNAQIESVTLYNLLGQKVLSQQLNVENATLDVSRLASGTYLLEVVIDNKKGIFKLIKE